MRYFSYTLFIIMIFCPVMLRLPAAIAEEPAGTTQQAAPAENTTENRQPSITRNPFVSAPYGRIGRTPPETGTSAYTGSIKKDSTDVPLKNLKLRGVLISNNNAVALLGHKILKTGDMMEDFIVTEITDKAITLSKGDTVIRFTIE